MKDGKKTSVLIIDGQGGRIGKLIIEQLREKTKDLEIIAVGSNSIATSAMLKSGADAAATGENAVIVAAKKVDIIAGPIGIVIADSLLGEITPKMAVAVSQSAAKRILIPMSQCDNLIVGAPDLSVAAIVEMAADMIIKEIG